MEGRHLRVQAIIENKMLNRNSFARTIGVATSNLAKMLSCEQTITDKTLYKISSAFPDVNLEWLKTGNGEMILENETSNARVLGGVYNVNSLDAETSLVKAIPVSALASFVENPSVALITEIDNQPVILTAQEKRAIRNLYIIKVEGESMEPTVKNKAEVLARQIPQNAWHNASGIVFVVFGDYTVIKRVKSNRLLSDNCIVLSSDNPEYGEMTVQLADIRAIFKAIRIISQDLD